MYYDNVFLFCDWYVVDMGQWVGVLMLFYLDDGIYNQFGIFVEWLVNWMECFSSVVGMRFIRIGVFVMLMVNVVGNDMFVYVNLMFQNWFILLGLNYVLMSNLCLVSFVVDGFRVFNFDDLVVINDNVQQDVVDISGVDLWFENSRNYDVGMKLDGDQLWGEVFYFWMDIEDMILCSLVSVLGMIMLFFRLNWDVHINGLELVLEWQLEVGWSVYGNFIYYYGVDFEMLEFLSCILLI